MICRTRARWSSRNTDRRSSDHLAANESGAILSVSTPCCEGNLDSLDVWAGCISVSEVSNASCEASRLSTCSKVPSPDGTGEIVVVADLVSLFCAIDFRFVLLIAQLPVFSESL